MLQGSASTAVAQVLAGAIGLAAGWASPGADGLYEVVIGTSAFGAAWLISDALFRVAARGKTGAA